MKFRSRLLSIILVYSLLIPTVTVRADNTEVSGGNTSYTENPGSDNTVSTDNPTTEDTSGEGSVDISPSEGEKEKENKENKETKQPDEREELPEDEEDNYDDTDYFDETDYYEEEFYPEEEEFIEEENYIKEDTDEESWLLEHNMTKNQDGMYEDVDENGRRNVYDPEDPEFYKYYHGVPKKLIGLNKHFFDEDSLLESDIEKPDPFIGRLTGFKYAYPSFYKTDVDADRPSVRYGIDVSKYQGEISEQNWSILKDTYNIEFAFIRAGYRGYGSLGTLNEDPCFDANIKNASKAGLQVGVYYFSQAISCPEAVAEAEHCIQIIGDNKDLVTLPVIIDYEYSGNPGRLGGAGLSRAAHTEIVNAFCERVSSYGFLPGIYANKSMLTSDMIISDIPEENYIWMANFLDNSTSVNSTTYNGRLNAWQYTSSFSGFGTKGLKLMLNDSLDLNFWFGDFPDETNGCSIKYDPNGGTGHMDPSVCKPESTITVPGCDYKRDGCHFREWNTEPDGSGESYYPGSEYTPVSKDDTLYAIWQCTVTLYISEDSDPEDTFVLSDGLLKEPPGPVREGYDFEGWYTDPSFSKQWDFASDIVVRDMSLYASWSEPMNGPGTFKVTGTEDRFYTGSAITFDNLEVYFGNKKLNPSVDYNIKYTNNIRAGEAGIIITGKGNFSGTYTETFMIKPLDITGRISAKDISLNYNGRVRKGMTDVAYIFDDNTQRELKAGYDYIFVYPGTDKKAADYDKAAFVGNGDSDCEYTVKIIGRGNYKGTAEFSETILKKQTELIPVSKLGISSVKPQILSYSETGELIPATPALTIRYKGQVLDESCYSLEYVNNDTPGTASVYITGKGNYTGSRKIDFRINALPLSGASVTGIETDLGYTCEPVKQSGYMLRYGVSKNDAGTPLIEGRDYKTTYSNNVGSGKGTVKFTGIGIYSGSVKKEFRIKPIPLVTGDVQNSDIHIYMGYRIPYVSGGARPCPEIIYKTGDIEYTLTEGKDYTLRYYNNSSVNYGDDPKKAPYVIITGKKNFTGKLKASFIIHPADISHTSVMATDIVYANRSDICKPSITVYDTNGKKLVPGRDYSKNIEYFKNGSVPVTRNEVIPSGTLITAKITGAGNYCGCKYTLFRYVNKSIASSLIRISNKPYTGMPVTIEKDDISLIRIGKTYLDEDDYEIVPGSYKNNTNSGIAKVTIKGIGDYGGYKTVSFRIVKKNLNNR